jgi:hypothetical protein
MDGTLPVLRRGRVVRACVLRDEKEDQSQTESAFPPATQTARTRGPRVSRGINLSRSLLTGLLPLARNTPSMTAALNKRPTSHHAHEAHQEPERWQSPSTSRHVKESREEAGLALLLLVHQRRKLLSGRR